MVTVLGFALSSREYFIIFGSPAPLLLPEFLAIGLVAVVEGALLGICNAFRRIGTLYGYANIGCVFLLLSLCVVYKRFDCIRLIAATRVLRIMNLIMKMPLHFSACVMIERLDRMRQRMDVVSSKFASCRENNLSRSSLSSCPVWLAGRRFSVIAKSALKTGQNWIIALLANSLVILDGE